jgi:2-succinyl-5-enolpyruvyl-6-hydroxy-3-cyclohexene-1-carboxylate synthase
MPSCERAAELFAAFAAGGVTDVVLSPGSRSTPLVIGAAASGLRLHDVVDERSAAFFALGQARASGRPSLLVCTSGTAGAHYYPAVLEAELASVPLIVLTADRPAELQQCGAAQTVDQLHLFGRHVRLFLEIGDALAGDSPVIGRIAAQAIAAALGAPAGPVHLDVRARKPFEPARLPVTVTAPRTPRVFAAVPTPSEAAIDALADVCRRARRGVIVAGPANVAQREARAAVAALAAVTGYPVVADAASQLRRAEAVGVEAILGVTADAVLQLGAPPVSAAWERWLVGLEGPHVVIGDASAGVWADPAGSASLVIAADVGLTCARVAERLGGLREPHEWTERWRSEAARVQTILEPMLAGDHLSELGAARDVVEAGAEQIVLGNSLPIRLADLVARAVEVPVLSQRGVSGIDGLVAGAAGAAQATGRSTALLLGDVSLLHDVGSLLVVGDAPLVVVVINNDGGRIFEQLPIAAVPGAETVMPHFTTSHGRGFRGAAAFAGLAYAAPATRSALRQALGEALAARRPALIEVAVPPHGAREALATLREALR